MIRSQRTPLVQRRTEKSEHERNVASNEEITSEEKKDIQENLPVFGGEEDEQKPYSVPNNSYGEEVFVPLIKNVISEDEMRWKDGYKFATIKESKYWNEYIVENIRIIKERTNLGIGNDSYTWLTKDGRSVPFTILGDGITYCYQNKGDDCLTSHHGYAFTLTKSLTLIFHGKGWGFAFMLRLIDDRIQNAAGRDRPQVVCYEPLCHVLKTTCQGWYNPWRQHAANDERAGDWRNLCLYGEVTLMYSWNVLHKGDEYVLLIRN